MVFRLVETKETIRTVPLGLVPSFDCPSHDFRSGLYYLALAGLMQSDSAAFLGNVIGRFGFFLLCEASADFPAQHRD
jgi:hypothetical protein